VGGVERVARELAARLPRLRPERYRVLQPHRALAHRAGHAWEQALLPLVSRPARLIYCPAGLAPLASRRNVIVIHDAAVLHHPEWYGSLYATYQRRLLPALAHRARHVVTVSEFARREIVETLGVGPERVSVVPNGVAEQFTPAADPEPARAAHGLERPYVLAVGSRIARKNLGVLHQAVRRLDSAGIELVSAGSGRGYMRPGPDAAVRILGYVEDSDLPGLYAGALALAMPSLYEGFGLPCLEAMACGTPVVAARRAALPETCGDAALLVDPDDAEGLADALLAAATDGDIRARLIARGRKRADLFPWSRSAELTDAIIGRLLGEAPKPR
jgi:glycosyltransferase involved in cell wall biosynthesis